MLQKAIDSFFASRGVLKLFLVDNSPTDELKQLATHDRIEYIHTNSNNGFGAGHNIAIKKVKGLSEYHIVLNPDIYFSNDVLSKLIDVMEKDKDTGIIMPNVLYPDGTAQPLAKLLPTPFDFLVRRFIPFKALKRKLAADYEMQRFKYDKVIDVPFLSGCFMFCKTEVLSRVNGFDEKIFMYTEDIDLCRRVNEIGYRTIIAPSVSVYHDHERKSFTNLKTMKIYVQSALYYFNKWGWLFDRKRKEVNKRTLSQI